MMGKTKGNSAQTDTIRIHSCYTNDKGACNDETKVNAYIIGRLHKFSFPKRSTYNPKL